MSLTFTPSSLSLGQAEEMWVQCMYISNDNCRYRFQTSSQSGQTQLHISTRPGITSAHTHTHTHAFILGHFRCYYCCTTAPGWIRVSETAVSVSAVVYISPQFPTHFLDFQRRTHKNTHKHNLKLNSSHMPWVTHTHYFESKCYS